MTTKILIVYEYRDELLVRGIEEKLRSNGFYNIRKDKISVQDQPANTNLEEADIILLAISQNFLNSAYFHSTQMQRAVDRHRRRKASIIFVMVQSVSLPDHLFDWLPIVPKDRIPILEQKNQELALQEIVSTIRSLLSPSQPTRSPATPSLAGLRPDSTRLPTAPPQETRVAPARSKLSDFLLAHQLLTIVLTIVLSILLGVSLGLLSGPIIQGLPVLSDPRWSNWLQIAGIIITILGFSVIKSKRLSYEVISDVGLLNEEKDRGEDDIKLIVNGWEENHARVQIVKLVNTGNEPVKKADYEGEPIRFQFNPRSLIRCSIHDIVPENKMPIERLKDFIKLDEQNYQFVDVSELPLNPKESINLKIVTRDKTSLQVFGSLAGGEITPLKSAQRKALYRTILMSLIISLLFGLVLPNFFSLISGSSQNRCIWGNRNIGSSTAFTDTMGGLIEGYQSSCLLAHLNLKSQSSADGLRELENGHVQLSTSEITPQQAGRPYDSYNDLQKTDLAIIPFALVIGKDVTGVSSLTPEQISKIYDGTYKTWDKVGGPADLAIYPIGRSSSSGTRYAFEHFVLKASDQDTLARTEDDTSAVLSDVTTIRGSIGYVDLGSANSRSDVTVIKIDGQAPTGVASNQYPFWAVERLYTKRNPDPLISAFIAYIRNTFQTNNTFVSLDDIKKDVISSHN